MNEKLNETLMGLTRLEALALVSALKSSKGNGHDFGYSDDVKVEGCNAQANGALVTCLIKKDFFYRDDEFGQIVFDRSEVPQIEAFLKEMELL